MIIYTSHFTTKEGASEDNSPPTPTLMPILKENTYEKDKII